MERLHSIQDICELLNVKKPTVRSWIFQKKIPFVRLGRLIRFRLGDIEKWMAQKESRAENK